MSNDAIQPWVEKAEYDLATARAMLKTGRYLYVLFCCQQALEKMLKAIIAKRTDSFPPRLHHLTQLADRAGLELNEDRARIFSELSSYYIQTRYPEEIESVSSAITQKVSRNFLRQTEDAMRWLSSMI